MLHGMAAVVEAVELHRGFRPRQRLEDPARCHRIRSFPVSRQVDALLVQAEQPALAVVGALECAVRPPAV
mgnify:CR=1 FL=1